MAAAVWERRILVLLAELEGSGVDVRTGVVGGWPWNFPYLFAAMIAVNRGEHGGTRERARKTELLIMVYIHEDRRQACGDDVM